MTTPPPPGGPDAGETIYPTTACLSGAEVEVLARGGTLLSSRDAHVPTRDFCGSPRDSIAAKRAGTNGARLGGIGLRPLEESRAEDSAPKASVRELPADHQVLASSHTANSASCAYLVSQTPPERDMRRFIIVSVLAALASSASHLGAQESLSAVRAVRLTYQKVDQVALDFGVDTAAMRLETARRLAQDGITASGSSDLPVLAVSIRVPKQLAPVDGGYVSVDLALLAASAPEVGSPLWSGGGPGVRFTSFGSLRALVPGQLKRQVEALLAARSSATTRTASPGRGR
jgi:hypothetical protein